MGGLATVVAALLGLILCHVACPVLVVASTLQERHPGLLLVVGAHFAPVWSKGWPRGSCKGGGGDGGGQRREESPLVVDRNCGVESVEATAGGAGRWARRGRTVQMRVRQTVVLVCLAQQSQSACPAGEQTHLSAGVKWRMLAMSLEIAALYAPALAGRKQV